jgi:hypothetical protein
MTRTFVFLCLYSYLINFIVKGQDVPSHEKIKKKSNAVAFIDQEIKRHKWEMNTNIGPLLKLGNTGVYAYLFLLKRNIGSGKNMGAWRLAAWPYLVDLRQTPYKDTLTSNVTHGTHIEPTAALGYEWQRNAGRFMLSYGIDLAGKLEIYGGKANDYSYSENEGDPPVIGRFVSKNQKSTAWLAPFVGGKFYLNHRLSVSLESHLQFMCWKERRRTWFKDKQVTEDKKIGRDIVGSPYHLFNLSYNF